MTDPQRALIDKSLRILVGRVNEVRWMNKPPPRGGAPTPAPSSAKELARVLRSVHETMGTVIGALGVLAAAEDSQ